MNHITSKDSVGLRAGCVNVRRSFGCYVSSYMMRYFLYAIIFCITSCSEKETKPASQDIYKYIFESLSSEVRSSPANKEVWITAGKPCFYKIEGMKYSFVSTLVDVGFGLTPWNEKYRAHPALAFDLLVFMIENGCSLDDRNPVNGRTPAHNAASLGFYYPDLARFVLKNSKQLDAKTAKSDPHYQKLTAYQILKKVSLERENNQLELELIDLLDNKHITIQ